MTRILGVDPGTRIVGFGIVDKDGKRLRAVEYGVLPVWRQGALPDRLVAVFGGIREVIARTRPDTMAIEDAFIHRNVKSAMRIGEGRAAAILAAAESGLSVFEYAPRLVKKAVSGSGRASKTQVESMVRVLLGIGTGALAVDAADALAVAICHAHRGSTPQPARRRSGKRWTAADIERLRRGKP